MTRRDDVGEDPGRTAGPGSGDPSAAGETTGEPAEAVLPDLPDLLGLGLEELRRLDHPVLAEVLRELRERVVGRPERLWAFDQAAYEPPAVPEEEVFGPIRH
ncbi:hypothetical protein GCM10009716_08620 [Streptomyces sodiiphilus]|uniref:FXSXX-COOH protein n=1 Tax=Streptomyces sodiiphilus TaxID=226217 RepID=A0ABN2NSE6_9ACTN